MNWRVLLTECQVRTRQIEFYCFHRQKHLLKNNCKISNILYSEVPFYLNCKLYFNKEMHYMFICFNNLRNIYLNIRKVADKI